MPYPWLVVFPVCFYMCNDHVTIDIVPFCVSDPSWLSLPIVLVHSVDWGWRGWRWVLIVSARVNLGADVLEWEFPTWPLCGVEG